MQHPSQSAPFFHSKNSQKIHFHMVLQVVEALQEIFGDERYADKVIEKFLKSQKKWGSRDRKFFAESVYDCVRWWRQLWWLKGQEPSHGKAKLIEIWAYQHLLSGHELPDLPELRDLPARSALEYRLKKAPLEIVESIPDWLNELGRAEMQDRWPAILKSLNQKSTVDLRVNTLKISKEKLRDVLSDEGVETEFVPDFPDTLTLPERKNVFATKAFKDGFFEMQDRASQSVAFLLDPQPGERVVDACAGAGGKTLHLASRMQNRGKVLAMDIHEWKLEELKKRAKRNGVGCLETRWIENTKVIKRQEETADRLLLDVPCSGLGVLRRNPDSKWKLTLEEIANLRKIQSEILESYSRMVKPGGKMVYATCSFLRSENEDQVEKFLAGHPEWSLKKMERNDPDRGRGDGFFAALLEKTKA